MSGLLFALQLLLSPAAAQDAGHHVDQARLFIKKQWYEDAAEELEQAIDLDGGSYDAWWLLAQVRYELLDAEGAYEAARAAVEHTRDPDEALRAQQQADFIHQTFGVLVIQAPYEGVQSRVQLERQSTLLDPDLKRFVDALALDWTHPQLLPLRVALPAGTYLIQGEQVELQPRLEATELPLPMAQLGNKGFSQLQVTRAELSTGVGAWMGSRTAGMRPSWEIQAGVTQPVGGLLVGVIADYSVRSYQVEGYGAVRHPAAATLGLRLGRELMVAGPLALRPGLGYRYGYLPGIPLACDRGSEAAELSCAAPTEGEPDVMVYAIGRAHIPFAELSVDWRRAGRTTATGLGVRVVVEHARGRVPSPSTADIQGASGSFDYTVEEPGWHTTGLRMMANFSHAF
jgi:hypothetical protein